MSQQLAHATEVVLPAVYMLRCSENQTSQSSRCLKYDTSPYLAACFLMFALLDLG